MFKVSGNYGPAGNLFERVHRGYEKIEPTFLKNIQYEKEAPIDRFIRYRKEKKAKVNTSNIKTFFEKILSKLGIK